MSEKNSFFSNARFVVTLLCINGWRRTFRYAAILPGLGLLLSAAQNRGLPSINVVVAGAIFFVGIIVLTVLQEATKMTISQKSTKSVRVVDLYVNCMYPKVSRPLAASDCCGKPADTAVEQPNGDRSWRCSEHRGLLRGNVTGPVHETVIRNT